MLERDDLDETAPGGELAIREPSARADRRPTLTALTGRLSGRVFHLDGGALRLGRAAECHVCLDDDGASRVHAEIRAAGGEHRVHDLASRNGTFVNGVRITGPVVLAAGDKLTIGSCVLRFAFHDELDDSFHERLLASALRDPLTNLFNKRYFLDRLDGELKFAERHGTVVTLLLLDLDHFKRVNDTHGHLAGDATLVHVSTLIAASVRDEDVVARFGGEELAVILRSTPIEPAGILAERLRARIASSRCAYDDRTVAVTVSVGMACTPAPSVDALIEAADRALYRAKQAGRDRVER